MARKRVVSPNIWTDEKFCTLPIEGRLFFIGLLNFADDEGIFINSPFTLKCQIFPGEDKITLVQLQDYLNTMVGLHILEKGLDIDGKQLLRFKNWSTHQKINHKTPTKYAFTPILEEESSTNVALPEDSSSTPSQYNINKDNIIKDNINKCSKEFERYWKIYPKKQSKERSMKAFNKLGKKELSLFVMGLEKHIKHWSKHGIDVQFIPLLSTFINGKRYNDELVSPVEKKAFTSPVDKEIYNRHGKLANEGKRMKRYLEDAEKVADDVPNLLEMKKELDNDKPLAKELENIMAKAGN
tara:strand:+ start:1205 stop:2095 length:891 start_codon:yes stop_codon:yes gene_type:complete